MNYYRNGKRFTAVSEDGRFIEAKEFKQVRTISVGTNKIITDDAQAHDEPITRDDFFNALYDTLNFLNTNVDHLNE